MFDSLLVEPYKKDLVYERDDEWWGVEEKKAKTKFTQGNLTGMVGTPAKKIYAALTPAPKLSTLFFSMDLEIKSPTQTQILFLVTFIV